MKEHNFSKNFFNGMGSVLLVFPDTSKIYQPVLDAQKKRRLAVISDEEAIRSDWEQVGKDILQAAGQLNEQ